MLENWDGFVWILVLLAPLLFLQRRLHREIQSVFLLVTKSREVALLFFSFIFLPGVLLHELSHFFVAKVLQVRTGRFSLVPQTLKDGRLQLGYVETARTDMVRDSLIGAAPLVAGGVFVTFAGFSRLSLHTIWEGFKSSSWEGLLDGLQFVHQRPDFWLWFYLIFTVSSTMFPSASDRRAWRPMVFIMLVLASISLVAGIGPWVFTNIMPYLNRGLQVLASVFGISLAVHLLLLFPVWGIRIGLTKLTGLKVV